MMFLCMQGKRLFRVRWKGYTSLNDTWEPVDNLVSCLDMVEEYERQADLLKKRRSEERKKRMVNLRFVPLGQNVTHSRVMFSISSG